MKIRHSFVTNSSSTSFTLMSKCSGFFPSETLDLTNDYSNIFNVHKLRKKDIRSEYYVVYYSAEVNGIDYDGEDDNDKSIWISIRKLSLDREEYELELNKNKKFLAEKNDPANQFNESYLIDKDITIININIEGCGLNEDGEPRDFVETTKLILETIKKNMLRDTRKKGKFSYSQMPYSFDGDGIDGGDPQGPFPWSWQIIDSASKSLKFKV